MEEDNNVQRCEHNNYDNVRICRNTRKMVLRCRDCQFIIRGTSQLLWNEKRCVNFTKDGRCDDGEGCVYLHIHYKKQKSLSQLPAKPAASAPTEITADMEGSLNGLPEESLLHTYRKIIKSARDTM